MFQNVVFPAICRIIFLYSRCKFFEQVVTRHFRERKNRSGDKGRTFNTNENRCNHTTVSAGICQLNCKWFPSALYRKLLK